MDMEQLKKQIEDEDFVIRLRPYADDDGKWSGEIYPSWPFLRTKWMTMTTDR
jgi:hypothetical protein